MNEEDFHNQPTIPELAKQEEGTPLPQLPEKIGPYPIQANLARGGMSLLYLGAHPETGEPTAIKVLSPKFLSHPDVVQRFLNEAEIIAMTDHPNIIKLQGHGEWEKGLYIAMEYIEGISLRKYLSQKPLSLKKALTFILDIAYALCHLHTHGVIHRDLKPENILINEAGSLKVIDFGIAQLLTEKAAPDALPKQLLIGTPIYISPEQKANPDTVSYPSDIYSLGIVSYELILGKLSRGHLHLSLMPKGLQPILKKCLKTDPEERYQDVVDFIADISDYLNSDEMEQELKARDQVSEFSDELKEIQGALIPEVSREWEGVEIGLDFFAGKGIPGIYCDFFPLVEGKWGIVLGEPLAKGAEGAIASANFRGMMKSLSTFSESPEEMLNSLNALTLEDPFAPPYLMSYLILDPQQKRWDFYSCGYGGLWKGEPDDGDVELVEPLSPPIGVDKDPVFSKKTGSWTEGTLLVLSSYPSGQDRKQAEAFDRDEFQHFLAANRSLPADQMAKSLLRLTKPGILASEEEKGAILLAFKCSAF